MAASRAEERSRRKRGGSPCAPPSKRRKREPAAAKEPEKTKEAKEDCVSDNEDSDVGSSSLSPPPQTVPANEQHVFTEQQFSPLGEHHSDDDETVAALAAPRLAPPDALASLDGLSVSPVDTVFAAQQSSAPADLAQQVALAAVIYAYSQPRSTPCRDRVAVRQTEHSASIVMAQPAASAGEDEKNAAKDAETVASAFPSLPVEAAASTISPFESFGSTFGTASTPLISATPFSAFSGFTAQSFASFSATSTAIPTPSTLSLH